MNTAVIIDDENLAIEELKYLVSQNKSIEVIGTFTNPLHALDFLKNHSVDVVFLDIQMPMKSGLELAKDIMHLIKSPKIIFVTAYDTYAIDAFNVNAIDYILKPTSQERLDQAVNKVIIDKKEDYNDKINTFIDNIPQNKDFITLYVDGIFMPIRYENIVFCQSDGGLVTIFTKNKEIPFSDTLSSLEASFTPPYFFRCHRSYIVNIQYIEKIEPTERTYLLKMIGNDKLIPVSRSNVLKFKKIMSIH
jgi:DNA-binding LytR/AlgR family response regulator